MSDRNVTRSIRRELTELAALFASVGAAHLLAAELGHDDPGSAVLIGIGVVIVAGAWLHRLAGTRRRRAGHVSPVSGHSGRPPRPAPAGPAPATGPGAPAGPAVAAGAEATPTTVWRVGTRIAGRPGRAGELAGLAAAFTDLGCTVLGLRVARAVPPGSLTAPRPAADPTDRARGRVADGAAPDARRGLVDFDEFMLAAPARVTCSRLLHAVHEAGGTDIVIAPVTMADAAGPGPGYGSHTT